MLMWTISTLKSHVKDVVLKRLQFLHLQLGQRGLVQSRCSPWGLRLHLNMMLYLLTLPPQKCCKLSSMGCKFRVVTFSQSMVWCSPPMVAWASMVGSCVCFAPWASVSTQRHGHTSILCANSRLVLWHPHPPAPQAKRLQSVAEKLVRRCKPIQALTCHLRLKCALEFLQAEHGLKLRGGPVKTILDFIKKALSAHLPPLSLSTWSRRSPHTCRIWVWFSGMWLLFATPTSFSVST